MSSTGCGINTVDGRRFFSTSSEDRPLIVDRPVRKRSVRFHGQGLELEHQLDGPSSDQSDPTPTQRSGETNQSRKSRSSSSRFESSHMNSADAHDTVLHRGGAKYRPSLPFLKTSPEIHLQNLRSDILTSPSTSSSPPSIGRVAHGNWSPISTASTTGTSITSPGSSGSRGRRHTPEDFHILSKSSANIGEETSLTPIEEIRSRYFWIPVNDKPIDISPTIVTVENAAAAKCALEIHFHGLLFNPDSPRAQRRKRFEQQLCDLGMSHDERVAARKQWLCAESDHLRQLRVLKSSSLARQEVKGVSIAGFDMIRVLGRGSFGIVRLVTGRHSNSVGSKLTDYACPPAHGEGPVSSIANIDGTAKRAVPTGKPIADVFAMKVIRKSKMLRSCQEGHLRAERDFLVAAEGSRWVVPLIASFQDNSNLYLVMEYMIGGDFLGLLLREDVLDEAVAQ